jgi:hypothetical protein
MSASGGASWALGIAPYTGSRSVATTTFLSGSGGSPSLTWDGKVNGSVPADGLYVVRLSIRDAAGNEAGRPWVIRIDRTAPSIRTVAAASFSPNGDGAADVAGLIWSSDDPISGWARVSQGSTVIRQWTFAGSTGGKLLWDGRSRTGAAVPDGTYTFKVAGRDAAGNLSTSASTIAVDRTILAPHWSTRAFFPQDGDAIAASARFAFTLTRPATVTVGIYSGRTLVRTIWSGRAMAAAKQAGTWDGRDGGGAFVPRGTYSLRVTATSSIGTSVASSKIAADAFSTSLASSAFAAGQTLTLTFSSTERLAALPTVTFTQPGRAAVKRTAVAVNGGRYRVSFVVAAGPAGSATLVIGARDASGGWNTTARTVTIH